MRDLTDAEWALKLERRLDELEHPSSVRLGYWQLTTDTAGRLVAINTLTGEVTIVAD